MKYFLTILFFLPLALIGQSDTLQVDVKDIDSTGKATIRTTVVASLASKLTIADSVIFSTKAYRQKLADSLNVLLAGKLNVNGNGSSLTGLTKTQVGLGNVDNTSDVTKNSAAAVLSNKTISAFNVGIDAGANDSYTITMATSPGSYTQGMVVIFKANTANTGAASINVNGLGVKTIVKRVNTTLANGDIPALAWCMLVYDGTNFVLLNPVVN